uniref:Uncharacterized protein n=1 Tax=Oryza punctata TaxID=4537 RepID=A0A0E0LTN1_ORYPU
MGIDTDRTPLVVPTMMDRRRDGAMAGRGGGGSARMGQRSGIGDSELGTGVRCGATWIRGGGIGYSFTRRWRNCRVELVVLGGVS